MFGPTATVGTWLTETCFNHLDPNRLTKIVQNTNGLTIKEKSHALFARVLNFSTRTRHIFFIASINTKNLLSLLSNSSTYAIHSRVTTAENNHCLALQINEIFLRLRITHLLIDVTNQIIERLVNTG